MKSTVLYLSWFIVISGISCDQKQRKIDLEGCLKEGKKSWYHCLSRIDWRRANFPIRPPRLRPVLNSDIDLYLPQSSELLPVTPSPTGSSELKIKRPNRQRLPDSSREYLVQAPSESRHFIAWIKVPLRRDQSAVSSQPVFALISSKGEETTSTSTTTTTTPRPMPKLLLPTPTRPAMYSLNGFVPKPKQQKKTVVADAKPKHRHPSGVRTMDQASSNRVTVRLDSPNALRKTRVAYASKTKTHYRTPKVGIPGIDYPTYSSIPETEFQCPVTYRPRMYADTETGCQVWHICAGSGGPKFSFICPNKSIFNEAKQTCDWWYRVECRRTKKLRRRLGRDV